MSRIPRRMLPDGIYHVVTRAVSGERAFHDRRDFRTFLKLVRVAVETFDWDIYAFCLMTTHYHLVVETERQRLSDGFRLVNGKYARAFNKKYARHGHLFGGRFSSAVIQSDEHLHQSCRYVLLNPVRAGLTTRSEDWPWSDCVYGRCVD